MTGAFEYGRILGELARIRPIDAPTRHPAGKGDAVCRGVAAISAERVQLHHFAREIFVQSTSVADCARVLWCRAQCVVQINEHRRVLCHSEEQVAEMAKRKGSDGTLLVVADPQIIQFLSGEDVEMVVPE